MRAIITPRNKYIDIGKHYTNILNTFAFPHYTNIILNEFKSYFDYDVSNKITVELNFIGYMLAKNLDNNIYHDNYFYKVFIFLDSWSNLTDKSVLTSNNYNKNKAHDYNIATFKIFKDIDRSQQSFKISDKYMNSVIASFFNTNLFTFTPTIRSNDDSNKESEYNVFKDIKNLNNITKSVNELKELLLFISNSIISKLSTEWKNDMITYLNLEYITNLPNSKHND